MKQKVQTLKINTKDLKPGSLSFKLFLLYDIFMVFIIVFNLFCLGANYFLMSSIGEWLFQQIHLETLLTFYRAELHPWVIVSEAWFIGFLIVELLIRRAIAVVYKHHQRVFLSIYSLVRNFSDFAATTFFTFVSRGNHWLSTL